MDYLQAIYWAWCDQGREFTENEEVERLGNEVNDFIDREITDHDKNFNISDLIMDYAAAIQDFCFQEGFKAATQLAVQLDLKKISLKPDEVKINIESGAIE